MLYAGLIKGDYCIIAVVHAWEDSRRPYVYGYGTYHKIKNMFELSFEDGEYFKCMMQS